MERLTQHLLLVLLGGITLRVALTDAYLAYLQAGFRPLLVLAGAVLFVLGVVGAVRDWPRLREDGDPHHPHPYGAPTHGGAPHGTAEEHADAHGHGHGPPRVAWLLVLPVAVLLLVAPPALGAYTADRQAQPVALPEPQERSVLRLGPDDPGENHRTMTLLDYSMYALHPDTTPLQGRRVKLTGFVLPRDDGSWTLARIRIGCCAADAVPISVVVDGHRNGLAADQWVDIVGSWGPSTAHPDGGYPEPVIVPASVTPVEPPASPYES